MVDAFRRRGLYPLGVRSLAPDSLVWEGPEEFLDSASRLPAIDPLTKSLLQELNNWNLSACRRSTFDYTRQVRLALHHWFVGLRDAGDPRLLEAITGLAVTNSAPLGLERGDDGLPKFEVHAVWPARRVGPDGQLALNLVVEVTQKRPGFRDPQRQEDCDRGVSKIDPIPDFTFRGGCTLIFDLDTALPRYFIRKDILAEKRLRRQRDFLTRPESVSLRATYFGAAGRNEPFALLHRDS